MKSYLESIQNICCYSAAKIRDFENKMQNLVANFWTKYDKHLFDAFCWFTESPKRQQKDNIKFVSKVQAEK